MAKQTTLWTALPNGYSEDGRSLRVSLLVSPRLEPDFDPRLESFPDFVDWPATLARSKLVVHFGGNHVTVAGNGFAGALRIDDRLGVPDSQVWTTLFSKTTFVRGFEFRDLSTHAVLSYPAADIDQLVRDLYGKLAVSAQDQLPTASTFLGDPSWAKLLNAVARHDEQFTGKMGLRDTRSQFAAFKNGAFSEPTLASNLARLELFHTPPSSPRVDRYDVPKEDAKARAEWLGYERSELPTPDDFKDAIDFHQIVAAMNQYPTLLRRLGLVIDLVIPRDAFPPAPNALLWGEVHLPPATPGLIRPPDASPRTHARLAAAVFGAVPRLAPQPGDFRVAEGLLVLDPTTFSLIQSDVDGAGLKVTNFARTLLTMRNTPQQQIDPVTRQKREIGAPALRNAGLVLVHNRRADGLKNSIARQSAFNQAASTIQQGLPNPPASPELFAEDVVRGYRVDIWDDVSKEWRSLCQRRATYDLDEGAITITVEAEEGTVRLAATTSPDPASNPDIIWLHETLVSWLGWSLCAPPPGRTIAHVEADHSDPVTDAEVEVPPGLRLRSAFTALPGSLPRLRYGRKYWIRARVTDLASNSLELDPRDFGPEQSAVNARAYLRYDPIAPPALALLKPTSGTTETPGEGESMERMAVRSFNDTPLLNTVPTPQRARRVVVPSRTTERDAEQHGLLDRAGIVDAAFFAMLAAQDNSLAEEKVLTAGPLAGGDPVETGYAVMQEGAAVPYLPEPLAASIAARIFNHPSFPNDKIITIPVYAGTTWPDALPFKIEIYDAPGEQPRYDTASRTLLVPLPKAARATLRLSVKPNRRALGLLGVWNWLTPAQQTQAVTIAGRTMTLEEMALRGQHWMLTPWRNVELVHAVQRPLIAPDAPKLQINREGGATFALPTFVAACSIASTDRLDLRANWNEPFEDAVANSLRNVSRTDHAFSVKITDAQAYAGAPEYLLEGPDLIRAGGRFHDRIGTKLHEFHDTRYRRIEYWLEATTKFREFMPAALLTESADPTKPTETHIKVIGTPVRTWIPCSAPPPAPEVLYVVPTFGWVRSDDKATKRSWRRGGGLRVYLNRSWNASGYGEMLAVVLSSTTFTGDPNAEPQGKALKNFVTQWGNDPIWLSPFVAGTGPKRGSFPLARTAADPDGKWLPSFAPPEEADQPPGPFTTTGLEHPELRTPTAQSRVEIAPHDVFFDEERQLWYCDIEVTWGSAYFPFIRLALARYQPVALHDAHLSNVVLADFMPLVPDRWLNVTHTRDPRVRQVNVFGHTYSSSSSHEEARHAPSKSQRQLDGTFIEVRAPEVAATSVLEVWVERFNAALGEDFGWEREAGAVVQRATRQPPTVLQKVSRDKTLARATDLLHYREFTALVDENLLEHLFVTPRLWEGTVRLPDAPGEGTRYRLAIAEYEEYLVDDATPYDPFPTSKGRRLVFIEYVELD